MLIIMKKIIFLSAIAMLLSVTLSAQQSRVTSMKQVYSVNYQMSLPVGPTSDFVSKMSFEGININAAFFLTNNWSVGIDLSWNNQHQKIDKQVYYPTENVAINAAQYRYIQSFPLKAQVKYFVNPECLIKAYAGLGVGALSSTQHSIIQDYDFWNSQWGFLLSPEIGVLIPFTQTELFGLNVTAGYNWATNKYDMDQISVKNIQGLYFNVGLFFAIF